MSNVLSNPRIAAAATATLTGGAAPSVATCAVNHSLSSSPTAGNATGQVDLVYSTAISVTAGTPLMLNLTSLTDPLSGAISFIHVNTILVSNDSTTAGQDFTVGGGSLPLNGDTHTAQANGGFALEHAPNPGFAVVSGTSQNLQITVAAGTNVPGKVTIFGVMLNRIS